MYIFNFKACSFDNVTLCICPSHLRMTQWSPSDLSWRSVQLNLMAFTGPSPWPQRWQLTHNASLSLTWHEQTEHLSLSRTQICPLCLTLVSWMQSPVQLCPCGQRQSYPPSRLKHTVSLAQVLRPVRHSLISVGGGESVLNIHSVWELCVCVCLDCTFTGLSICSENLVIMVTLAALTVIPTR